MDSLIGPGTTRYGFHAGTTMPDPHSSSFHLGLATEGASVLGVLAYFNLLHHFPEGGTITGPVFTDNPDLLGAFSLLGVERETSHIRTRDGHLAPPNPFPPITQPPPVT